MKMTTIDLIRAYLSRVDEFVASMKKEYGVDNLILAHRARLIPSRGTTSSGMFKFRFHGIGCEVEGFDAIFDFDFGDNGTTGGFDAWRLFQFANSFAITESFGLTESTIQHDLERLLTMGMVHAPKQDPSPHLFYLTKQSS